jgi:hypothetical protein
MRILGVTASGFFEPGIYELITSTILTSNEPSVTFESLNEYASEYKHLQLRMITKTNTPSQNNTTVLFRFNSDSGTNYARHSLVGNGLSVSSSGQASQNTGWLGLSNGGTSGSLEYNATIADILDPFNSSKNTVTRSSSGQLGGNFIGLYSSLWNNVEIINSLEVVLSSTNNFVTGSRFSLYGIRG